MELAAIQRELARRGVGLAAISADPTSASKELRRRLGVAFPLLSDPDLRVTLAYGVGMAGQDIAVPSVFIIDATRQIQWRYIGETQADRPDTAELLSRLESLPGS